MFQQMYRCCSVAFLLICLLSISSTLSCDVTITLEDPGVMKSTAKIEVLGVETLDKFRKFGFGSRTTDFGLGKRSPLKGTYSDLKVEGDKEGKHSVVSRDYQTSLKIHGTNDEVSKYFGRLPNYFGVWIKDVNGFNLLEFYNREKLIFQQDGIKILFLAGGRGYYEATDLAGNPIDWNLREMSLFLNFFFNDCEFDEVQFVQRYGSSKMLKSDNHSVGYFKALPDEVVGSEEIKESNIL